MDLCGETGRERLRRNLADAQHYWSRKAQEKGVLTEEDLDRLLR